MSGKEDSINLVHQDLEKNKEKGIGEQPIAKGDKRVKSVNQTDFEILTKPTTRTIRGCYKN